MSDHSQSTRHLGADIRPLEHGWTLETTPPGHYGSPPVVGHRGIRLSATVPGTAASALAAAGLFDPEQPAPLHDRDVWYYRSLAGERPGPAILRLEGLATIAEVYVNGELVLSSRSMFECNDVSLALTGSDEIAICFRALTPLLAGRGPRARWRPQMMDSQGLRLFRTTMLGHMPGWCPDIHPVGPYRPISLIRPARHAISDLRLAATLDDDRRGKLAVEFRIRGEGRDIRLRCAGHEIELEVEGSACTGELSVPAVKPWWPHTHGRPDLHDAQLLIDGESHSLGLVGFRRIDIDRGKDGRDFAVRVNGERIFCRGSVWTNADILRLPGTAEDYAPWLAQAVDAGMNMIRIGGTMTYETADFFRLCDRLGLLVWQDLMFANFDYPVADEAFLASVEREIAQVLDTSQGSPSLAVVCGGSEVYQQAAMLGLPETIWRGSFYEEKLATWAAKHRPDTAYVANSPSGGAMPFSPNEGVTHYYGVGAYCRPLEDARRANVRFAAECLAFAHVPQQATLDRDLPVSPVHDPRWKARVPRDRGASWDFEDVRDHYLAELYQVEPGRLRREDPLRYLALSRAVTTEVLADTYAEWRRPGSSCNGALTWTFQDLMPGPGWGVIDSTGRPKPAWFALKRSFRPIQILLSDEGTNGLDVHVVNESALSRDLMVEVTCYAEGRRPVVSGRKDLIVGPRHGLKLPCTDLFGAFFDTTYAFRFGPPSHDVTVARLVDPQTTNVIAEAFHFPRGRSAALHGVTPTATLTEACEGQFDLTLRADSLLQSVHVEAEGFACSDDWFHLAPAQEKCVRLTPLSPTRNGSRPSVQVTSIASAAITSV